jgi:hypothetical protein
MRLSARSPVISRRGATYLRESPFAVVVCPWSWSFRRLAAHHAAAARGRGIRRRDGGESSSLQPRGLHARPPRVVLAVWLRSGLLVQLSSCRDYAVSCRTFLISSGGTPGRPRERRPSSPAAPAYSVPPSGGQKPSKRFNSKDCSTSRVVNPWVIGCRVVDNPLEGCATPPPPRPAKMPWLAKPRRANRSHNGARRLRAGSLNELRRRGERGTELLSLLQPIVDRLSDDLLNRL